MGNIVNTTYLTQAVSPKLLFLTNCNLKKGTNKQITHLFKIYSSIKQPGSFYISLSLLKQLTKKTPLFGFEDSLFQYFRTYSMKVNIMEVFAGIITYSTCPWKLKSKLAFLVFDFDNSEFLNKAEMAILIISFVRGIASMTNSSLYDSLDLEPLGKHCYELASQKKGNIISVEELTAWVGKTPEVFELLSKNENNRRGSPKNNTKRSLDRTSVRYSSGSKRVSKVRNTSLPLVKTKREWKNRERDIQNLHEIFYKIAGINGLVSVGKIYQELIQNKVFQKDAEFLFHEFDFDMKKNIEFSQLLDYFEKVKSRTGYSLKVGRESIYPTMEQEDNQVFNISALKKLFENYDKNKDGYLNFQELLEGLKKYFDRKTITEIFEKYDGDGNKLIDFNEFIEIFSPYRKLLS